MSLQNFMKICRVILELLHCTDSSGDDVITGDDVSGQPRE
jgi:hypothetical protein